MIDSHCHLTHQRLTADREEVLLRAQQAGLTACVTIGTGVEDARACRELAQAHDWVHCTAGLDPFSSHAAADRFEDELSQLEALLEAGGFVALGEIGLDFHYELGSADEQIERFEAQLSIAQRRRLPVVIHVREAHREMIEVLGRFPAVSGVIHSFTGGLDEARAYVDLGWMLAFNGVLTFRNAAELREAAKWLPPERMLVETDSPYLAPVPLRGRRCEPAYVAHTLAVLAELRGEAPELVTDWTSRNARRLFDLPAAGRADAGAPA